VSYVLGEFYWRVQVGETASVEDYVAPPLMLSRETTAAEETWSVGEYIEPDQLWQGFKLKTTPPRRVGIGPNQPAPSRGKSSGLGKLFVLFVFAALVIQIFILFTSTNRKVFENDFRFDRSSAEKSFVTEPFDVPGHVSNLVVQSKAEVDNAWIYLSMALINEETGNAYDFGREISFYHGVDGGESWSEGSRTDEAVLPTVPAGRYYLRIEPEAEIPVAYYHLTVFRDVPNWYFLFITIGLLTFIPILHWWRGRQFEVARWSESDHPMVSSSSASDSDDD